MAEIKVDLATRAITVKVRRTLMYFIADNDKESLTVTYREVQYTGTIGNESYAELTNNPIQYEADFKSWIESDIGIAIKASIEVELALDLPGTPNE